MLVVNRFVVLELGVVFVEVVVKNLLIAIVVSCNILSSLKLNETAITIIHNASDFIQTPRGWQ